MQTQTVPMTLEHAVAITNDLLDVFQALVQTQPIIQLSELIENGQTKFITTKFGPNNKISCGTYYGPKVENDFCLDIRYAVIWKDRYFRISFFDDPDELGYCSILPDYDPSTYILCEIVEERNDGSSKHEMIFGFDIENRTFLELFDISHYNKDGIHRAYPTDSWNCPIEKALKDAIIL